MDLLHWMGLIALNTLYVGILWFFIHCWFLIFIYSHVYGLFMCINIAVVQSRFYIFDFEHYWFWMATAVVDRCANFHVAKILCWKVAWNASLSEFTGFSASTAILIYNSHWETVKASAVYSPRHFRCLLTIDFIDFLPMLVQEARKSPSNINMSLKIWMLPAFAI